MKSEEVGALFGGGTAEDVDKIEIFRELIALPQHSAGECVQLFGRKLLKEVCTPSFCKLQVTHNHPIAHFKSLLQEFGDILHTYQSLFAGILRIEQVGIDFRIALVVGVVEDGHIEEHLNAMVQVWALSGKLFLSTLLLNHHVQISCEQVHTSLHTEHLAEEGGLQQHLFMIVDVQFGDKLASDEVVQILLLLLCFLMKVGKRRTLECGCEREGVGLEEALDACCIVERKLMDGFVQELRGEVSQQERSAGGRRQEAMHDMEVGRDAKRLKAR